MTRPWRWSSLAIVCTLGVLTGCAARGPSAFDRGMAQAAGLAKTGRRHDAALAYAEVAKSSPDPRKREEAAYSSAVAYEQAGDQDTALAAYDELARGQGERAIRAAFRATLIRHQRGDVEGARNTLAALLHRAPEHGIARHALRLFTGELEREHGPMAVITWEEQQLASFGTSKLGEEVSYDLAHRKLRVGDSAGALRAFLSTAERWPYPRGGLWDDSLWYASVVSEQRGDLAGAIASLRTMLAPRERSWFYGSYNRPRMPAAQLRIGELERLRGNPRAAVDAFRAVRELFPETLLVPRARFEEAATLASLGDGDGACRVAAELLKTAPDTRWARRADEPCPALADQVHHLVEERERGRKERIER